jgi:hypothetical protein
MYAQKEHASEHIKVVLNNYDLKINGELLPCVDVAPKSGIENVRLTKAQDTF